MHGLRVTVGYHRLYSHRAFRATFGVRLALAILGTSAMQGSIKVCSFFSTEFIMLNGVHEYSGGTYALLS